MQLLLHSSNVFAAFTIYYLAERALRHIVSKYFLRPEFLKKLRWSHKDKVYFGILLGVFITSFTFPFCTAALWKHNPFSSDKERGPISLAAEICITSRGILWVSELNRLDLYPSYVYHHIGSIAILLSAIHLEVPEILLFPFTTLISEIPGDVVWLSSAHHEMDQQVATSPQWKIWRQKLQTVNFWVYALTRLPSIPLTAYSAFTLTKQDGARWSPTRERILYSVVFAFLSGYLVWIVVYLKRHRK